MAQTASHKESQYSPERRGVEICCRHERVQNSPSHGHPRGVGERGVELHVVHVHLRLVQVPHVTREGQVEQDGNTIRL